MKAPRLLYEDNHLLVVDKPASLPTAGVQRGGSETGWDSVHQWAGQYLKRKYNKPGNVFVGVVSRLDRVTSGVLVLARTSKAASRLSDQIRRGTIGKTYLAIVRQCPQPDSGTWTDWVRKDDAAKRMRVVPGPEDDRSNDRRSEGDRPQKAILHYEVLHRWTCRGEPVSAVRVRLETGRKHQIRLQMAQRGHTVWADHKYGDPAPWLGAGIALHAWQLALDHPTRRDRMVFSTDPPPAWNELLPTDWRPPQP